MRSLHDIRSQIRAHHLRDEHQITAEQIAALSLDATQRAQITHSAMALVDEIRSASKPGLMDVFLAEYGLSTDEGVALMCLAEALLRVPDAETIDALIEDKIAPSEWGKHLGQSSSSLVNASSWALMLTGKVLDDGGPGLAGVLRGAVRRLGEPVIRAAVARAMKEMGAQFVLGQTIDEALHRGRSMVARGYSYSYDMLGEAALTMGDADAYFRAYRDAITALSDHCAGDDIRANPGISIKLSALHPRYEEGQHARVMDELVPRVLDLAQRACAARIGLNIDAEEADRLDLSLDVIEAVLRDPSLAGWDGFGIVVQAYGRRAGPVIDWLYALAAQLDRKIMVRLVKGAYWDSEIKRAQVEGLADFPVFTQKSATDISYIANARKLLGMTDRIYPQFATHNAQTVAAVLALADDLNGFEFQRLHGMGAALHEQLRQRHGTRCRIYAPVGAHRDLLAYLVRRLLENGANSSFVNQIVDLSVPAAEVVADPLELYDPKARNAALRAPCDLYGAERRNAQGWDLHDRDDLAAIERARAPFRAHRWSAGPITVQPSQGGAARQVRNPANPGDLVGEVTFASAPDLTAVIAAATPWAANADQRQQVLNRAADLYEQHFGEIFALLTREAGKTPMDAIAELREAVDFLRYYGAQGRALEQPARGIFACISPWNFPLAIFTGQIAAALAAGNAVLAKPAEATGLIAALGVRLLHEAGVPRSALQFLPGDGAEIGAGLSADPRIAGLCFTGSTATAQRINLAMAAHLDPAAPLIAETGGLNAMIVDSTALPEQAVKDIVASAFQSAGQRCSALRCLYVQEDVFESVREMLFGAMDELVLGDPWLLSTDIGPVIDAPARDAIRAYIAEAQAEGRVLKQLPTPAQGHFIAPTVIAVKGIADLSREVFGPVLHLAPFAAGDLDAVVDAINASGYGLTFGMHSRIDDRVQQVSARLNVGNLYVNRNQIGAIVGAQPFGGEGLSGTGPKAGGPAYLPRFTQAPQAEVAPESEAVPALAVATAQRLLDSVSPPPRRALDRIALPGPTGESNMLSSFPRGVMLCLGPSAAQAQKQAAIVRAQGCRAVRIAPGARGEDALDGRLDPRDLAVLSGFDLVALWGEAPALRAARIALAGREGRLIPLCAELDLAQRCRLERHICIDTTAAGGNVALLADAS